MGNGNCPCCHFFEPFPVLVCVYSDEESARGAQFSVCGKLHLYSGVMVIFVCLLFF